MDLKTQKYQIQGSVGAADPPPLVPKFPEMTPALMAPLRHLPLHSVPYQTVQAQRSRNFLNHKCQNPILALGHDRTQGPRVHRRKASTVEIDESKIETKAGRVLCEEMRKKLEKWGVKEVVPMDDEEASRRA